MLTIIHGDNLKDSRNFYLQLKEKVIDSITLQGDKINITDLTEAVEGNGLFVENKDVFIENLFSKRKIGKELEALIEFLKNHLKSNIVLWEQKQLTKPQQKKLVGALMKEYSYPQTLFQLLDELVPLNSKKVISLYHQTLLHVEPEIILFMITKQVRLLLALKESSDSNISELNVMQWQKPKLLRQSKLFNKEHLLSMHEQLFNFDWQYKTGNLTQPLPDTLDFFLAEI